MSALPNPPPSPAPSPPPSPHASPINGRFALLTAVALAALVLWLHLPFLQQGGVLGAPGTDVIRAAWGLDHQVRALPGLPFWTDRVGFPEGVKLLILPMVSSLCGAPLHLLLGPIAGYNLWILALLWASGMATALLAWRISGSPSAGLLAGAALIVQPMMLLAVTDGTPEYVAFWALPLALLAVAGARHATGPRASIAAGLALAVMALDSPYNAIFILPFLPIVLAGTRWRNLLILGGVAACGAAILIAAYWGLPVGEEGERRGTNAVQLGVWRQWDTGAIARPWEYTLAPGFLPLATVAGALALAALRPIRALPWVLVAVLCVVFALGTSAENPTVLGQVWGPVAAKVGRAIVTFNEHVHVPVVRFPRRWLVPAALSLGMAAAIGLSRIRWEWARLGIAVPAALATVHHTITLAGYREALPRFDAPAAAFATFVHDHDADGAVLALPTVRAANTAAIRREDLPIFAALDPAIRSADQIWIQLATGRASVYVPDGLRTMQRRTARAAETDRLLHALDDLTTPHTTGRPIAPSATGDPARRVAAAGHLIDQGVRFVILDEVAYGSEGMAYAREAFAARITEERHFDDGTGVTVWVVE